MGRREEEIRDVIAEAASLVDDAEAAVEALARLLRGQDPAPEEEGKQDP